MRASGEHIAGRGSSRCRSRNILVCCRRSQRLEPEGVSEQLIRGLIGHGKDSGPDTEMLRPGKRTCPNLDLNLLCLLCGE